MNVVDHKGSGKSHQDKSKAEEIEKGLDGGKGKFSAAGGVHNPSNRLPAGEDSFGKKNTIPDNMVTVVPCLSQTQLGVFTIPE